MESTGHVSEERVDDLADLADLAEGALLSEASEVEALLREAEVHKLRIAYQWAIAHPALEACETPAGPALPSVLTSPESLGGTGTPAVAAFTPEPLAVALGCSPASASALLADALDLHHRLPLLWDQVRAQLLATWKARRVATRTRHLSFEAARWADRQIAGRASSLGLAALDRIVAEAGARCEGDDLAQEQASARDSWDVVLVHPDPHRFAGTSELRATGVTLDLTRFHDVICAEAEALGALGDTDDLGVRKAKALGVIADAQARLDLTALVTGADPEAQELARRQALGRRDAKVRLYLHASFADVVTSGFDTTDAIGSVEGIGPVTLDLVRQSAGRARVTIQPVLHVAADDRWSVDRHDPPPRMAEQVRLRDDTCIFPWCADPPASATSTTATRSRTPATEARPARPHPTHLPPCADDTTAPRPQARGPTNASTPAPTSGLGPAGLTALVTPRGTVRVPG